MTSTHCRAGPRITAAAGTGLPSNGYSLKGFRLYSLIVTPYFQMNRVEAGPGFTLPPTHAHTHTHTHAHTPQMNLVEADPGFTQAQLAMVDISNALAEERDAEIRKVVETISELAQVCVCVCVCERRGGKGHAQWRWVGGSRCVRWWWGSPF